MSNGWIDIKKAKAGYYIFASKDEDIVELISLDNSGFIEAVDINGCEWSGDIIGLNGYVKKAKATELCPLLNGGES